jgi:hypothetical protein
MSNQTIAGKTNYNTDPNHIYYNLQAYNNDTIGSSQSVPVRFTETRTSTILANPSEYFLSIIRFHLDTPNLPLFLPTPETSTVFNPTQNVNQLVYQIAIYQGGSLNAPDIIPIIFRPQLNTSNNFPPPPVLDLNALSNPYYFIFQFQDFLDMINLSIQNYYYQTANETRMVAATNIPYFGMEAGNRFTVYFPSFVNTNTGSAPPVKGSGASIWNSNGATSWMMAFNAPLHTLFSSLRYQYIDSLKNLPNITATARNLITSEKSLHGWYLLSNRPAMNSTAAFLAGQPSLLEQTNQMGLNQLEILPISAVPFAGNIYSPAVRSFEVLRSPYSSAPLLNPVKQLIFTTALMPVNNELVGLPVVQNSDPRLNSDIQNNNFSPVITDLEVPLISGDETKCNVSYSPSGEYRLIDLQSNQPINSIEISVYWKDQYGYLHPFTLEPGCFSSLKLLFRKKVFNLIYLPEYTKPVN